MLRIILLVPALFSQSQMEMMIREGLWKLLTCSFSPLVVCDPQAGAQGSAPGEEPGGCEGVELG